MKQKKSCKECGDEFTTYRDGDFCSQECWQNSHRTLISCKLCEEEFEVRKSREDRKSFCSEECQSRWRKSQTGEDNPAWDGGNEVLECEFCSSEYERIPSKAEESRFCSLQCLADWKSENSNAELHYGKKWHNISREVRARDNNCCQNCEKTNQEHIESYGRQLPVHHIKPLREFDSTEEANQKSNLVTLCIDCHTSVEADKIKLDIKKLGDK